ncbi:MAG TPA: sigma-70 family RNA polymerase sigma factor [Thermoanaerobaculia bacterium]|nr:sigma-70 family RNA polymerase sigma factor [Thermoanaerobaculia bacterium]
MPPSRTQTSPGDEEILAAVQALQRGASRDVFEVLFRRYYDPLYKFFANRPSLRDEAEDLVQATLLRAYERIGLYRPEEDASFASWLRKIAENVWKNAVRERVATKRSPPGDLAGLPVGEPGGEVSAALAADRRPAVDPPRDERPNPEEALLAHERTRVLQEALESLPPGMRRCTELRLFADLKYQEIANLTGIGLNSVRSQLFEARQRLKPVLDSYFQGADL